MIGLILVAVSLQARATDVPCTVEGLQLCQVYESGTAKITYPDGTFIPNLNALAFPSTYNAAANDLETTNRANAEVDEHTARSVAVSNLLQNVKPALSPAFIFYASGHLAVLKDLLDGFEVYLPWPATGASKMQKVAKADVSSFNASLPADQRRQLRDLAAADWSKTVKQQSRVGGTFSTSGKQLIEDMNSFTDDRLKHVSALFDEMKRNVSSVIRNGRTDEALSAEEKAALAKIESVKMNPYIGDIRRNANCLGIEANAFYQSLSNTISLCPNILNYPDATLAMTIGHELGHAVDVCFSQSGVYKINRDVAKRLKEDPKVTADNAKYAAVSYALDNNVEGVSARFFSRALSVEQLSFLKEAAVLQPQVSGVPFSDYVFKDVYACLISPRGGGFRSQSKSEIAKSVDQIIESRKATRGSSYNAVTDRNRLMSAISETPECSMTNNSQMQEVMADWIGQTAQEFYFKAHPTAAVATTPKDRMALVGIPGSFACSDQMRVQVRPDAMAATDGVINAAERTQRSINDPHPSGVKRMNDLILRDPILRKSLGCAETASPPRCEHRSGVSKSEPAASGAKTGSVK